jgi:uncharacterized phage protein (TIGR02218 family)
MKGPTSLIEFSQQTPNTCKADLFVIELPNGQTINATSGGWDITVPSGTNGWTGATTTFSANTYGRWERGAITSEAGFDLSSNSMSLTCIPQSDTSYPNLNVGILAAAFNGLFDAAIVNVFTAYMPTDNYGDVSVGIETKFAGFIEKITNINRLMVEFECQDPFYLMNQKIPGRIIQAGCQWSFADGNCAISGGASAFTQTFTAKTGSTSSVLIPTTAFTQAEGYFQQGVVTCTSGANAGLSQTVKLHASGQLTMTMPFILPVNVGDGFSAIKGCDKSTSMCANSITATGGTVNNLIHYSGAIAVPVPLDAI